MKVLIIGSGGREHVLAWKIKQSPLVDHIYCAPGNGGTEKVAESVDIAVDNYAGLLKFAKDKRIGLTVVGPEVPLVGGIVNLFEEEGLKIFGPTKEAAQLEGSKVFAKEFMRHCNIPTAAFETFRDINQAKDFLQQAQYPLVVKADGLAAGKGVIICKDQEKAVDAVTQIMQEKIFKEAGNTIIIEECLEGEEVSILAVSDGDHYVILDSAQDHKRIFDDDMGPNTGGMGAYSPAPIANVDLLKKIATRVIDPTVRGMRRENIPFKGILYVGIMVTKEGPMVLEFNVRFGDPEAQAMIPRLKNDLMDILLATCKGELDKIHLDWSKKSCVCVVMSAGGYPGKYKTGDEIKGIDAAEKIEGVEVFHAGTKNIDGKTVTAGGRVLGVTGIGDTVDAAIKTAYKGVEAIEFEKCFFRRDIGAKALASLIGSNRQTTTRN